jgi:N,N'-diacetyllegionaminate synthase
VAEAELNHNGDIDIAKKMIETAKNMGADAVKFQTFHANKFCSLDSPYLELFKQCELTARDFSLLKEYGKTVGMHIFSTASEMAAVDIIHSIGFTPIKIGSSNIDNYPLLNAVAETTLDVVLSTGGASIGEIEEALALFTEKPKRNIALLHCVMAYPAPAHSLNLNRITLLRDVFGHRCTIGYSDHSRGTDAAVAAVALGARIIEKHFTLDHHMEGPDHSFSADPVEFKQLVDAVRNAEKMMGNRYPTANPDELSPGLTRRFLVASRDLNSGDTLTADCIEYKRIGENKDGIPTKYTQLVTGCRIKNPKKIDEPIHWHDVLNT